MNKILQSASTGDINVTNDGATILKAIQLDNAAAKILVNISKVQDDEVGDGTTTVTVLAAELVRGGEVDCPENSSSDDCGGISDC
jgi:T-complex protein 1 subunit beta